jgi:four helix bundle protein
LTQRRAFVRDTRLREQTDDAIESVCRNVAEGFGADTDPEFHRFLVIARRSLNELHDSLRSAELKGHVTAGDVEEIRALGRRLYPALNTLMRHLEYRIRLRREKNRRRKNTGRRTRPE